MLLQINFGFPHVDTLANKWAKFKKKQIQILQQHNLKVNEIGKFERA